MGDKLMGHQPLISSVREKVAPCLVVMGSGEYSFLIPASTCGHAMVAGMHCRSLATASGCGW